MIGWALSTMAVSALDWGGGGGVAVDLQGAAAGSVGLLTTA